MCIYIIYIYNHVWYMYIYRYIHICWHNWNKPEPKVLPGLQRSISRHLSRNSTAPVFFGTKDDDPHLCYHRDAILELQEVFVIKNIVLSGAREIEPTAVDSYHCTSPKKICIAKSTIILVKKGKVGVWRANSTIPRFQAYWIHTDAMQWHRVPKHPQIGIDSVMSG